MSNEVLQAQVLLPKALSLRLQREAQEWLQRETQVWLPKAIPLRLQREAQVWLPAQKLRLP